VQRTPQLAAMSDQRSFISQDVRQEDILLPAKSSERLVF
jgi:hypothetical protein